MRYDYSKTIYEYTGRPFWNKNKKEKYKNQDDTTDNKI